jgi:hypothetical protein
MIVLNSEKEIIRVETWDDITTRPGFNGDLNPNEHKLESIIGRYAFKERVPCGLSNCHTPHGLGYIVVTKDGQETNIGKDCGKTYFGVDFLTMSNKFDRDITEKENRDRLWSFFFRSEEVQAQVTAMRNEGMGANWVFKQTMALQDHRQITSKAVRHLNAMVKSRNPALVATREATEEEIAQREAAQGRRLTERPVYIDVYVGDLAGLEAMYSENNLKVLLVDEVEERIKVLQETNIDTLTYEQLSKWSKWVGGLDAILERAASAVQAGRLLLKQSNLLPLGDAANMNTDELNQLKAYLRTLPA